MPLLSEARTASSTKTLDKPFVSFSVCAFVVFLCLCMRNMATILAPALLNEDGRDLFGPYYNGSITHGLARFYAGYLSLMTNIAATAIAPLPVTSQPALYVVVSLMINAMCISCFALPIFRAAIRSDRLRLSSCLLVSLSPMSLNVIDTEIGYIQWPISIVLFQLTAINALGRGSAVQRTLILIVMSSFSLSIPSSVVIIPILLYDIIEQRKTGQIYLHHLMLMVVLMTYAWFGRSNSAYEINSAFLVDGSRALVEHIFSDAIFGSILRQMIQMRTPLILYAAALALISLACRSASEARGNCFRRYLACLLYISVVTMFLSAAIRGVPVERIWPRRFSYAQSVMISQILVSSWAVLLIALPFWRRVISVTLVLAFLILTNTLSRRSYSASTAAGLEVRDLTTAVAQAEERGETRKFHLERGPWSIDLQSRPKAAPEF